MPFLQLNQIFYDIQREIGAGGHGSVFSAITPNGTKVAIKEIPLEKGSFINERAAIEVLNSIKSSSICKVYQATTIGDNAYIVMDLYKQDLFTFCAMQNWTLTEQTVKIIFKKICVAVKQMHSVGLAHLDLKPENVLMNSSISSVAVCDFGSSRWLGSYSSPPKCCIPPLEHRGSKDYSSPELTAGCPFDPFQSDVYSLGVLLFVLFTGTFPTPHGDISTIRNIISPAGYGLLSRMLSQNPKTRPTIFEVSKHPYFGVTSQRTM